MSEQRPDTPLAGRTVAVTGALGFVAAHLVPRLLERHTRVVAVVRPGRDAAALERAGCELRNAELSVPGGARAAFEGCELAVHLAGMALAPWLVDDLESAGVRRVVFIGSAGVYTRLESRGADRKREGEARLRASSLDYVILRPSMIYGTPRDRNLVRLLRWIERFPLMPVPDAGRTLQQPVHVDDLVSAILAALERGSAARREYDVGGPAALSLADIMRESARALGRPLWLVPIPLAPAHALARLARALRLRFPVSPEQVLRLAESKAVDISAARTDLGFDPRSFATGIGSEVEQLRDRVSPRPPRGG